MRPVNLIPPEQRRGDRAPSRTGGLAYVVLGVLAVAVIAVTAIVLTGNQIADRKAKVADLNSELTQASAQAKKLQSYANFAASEQARVQTVHSLALSRFDWYRVLHELSLVIPNDVWLTSLQGSVSQQAADSGSATSSTSSSSTGSSDVTSQITGPSLQIDGCAAGHDAVAGFIGSLKEIDGVTRVVVTASDRPNGSSGGSGSSAGSSSGCEARNFVATFHAVVAFDNVPIDPTTGMVAPPPVTATSTGGGGDTLASAGNQNARSPRSVGQQTAKAHQAASSLIPGAVRP